MTNEERNTALYQKMFAEQESFRDWLKGQLPLCQWAQQTCEPPESPQARWSERC